MKTIILTFALSLSSVSSLAGDFTEQVNDYVAVLKSPKLKKIVGEDGYFPTITQSMGQYIYISANLGAKNHISGSDQACITVTIKRRSGSTDYNFTTEAGGHCYGD